MTCICHSCANYKSVNLPIATVPEPKPRRMKGCGLVNCQVFKDCPHAKEHTESECCQDKTPSCTTKCQPLDAEPQYVTLDELVREYGQAPVIRWFMTRDIQMMRHGAWMPVFGDNLPGIGMTCGTEHFGAYRVPLTLADEFRSAQRLDKAGWNKPAEPQRPDPDEEMPCSYCGGTGNNDDNDSTDESLCPECHGCGKVRRRVEPVAQDCPSCGAKAAQDAGHYWGCTATDEKDCWLADLRFPISFWNRLALREEKP